MKKIILSILFLTTLISACSKKGDPEPEPKKIDNGIAMSGSYLYAIIDGKVYNSTFENSEFFLKINYANEIPKLVEIKSIINNKTSINLLFSLSDQRCVLMYTKDLNTEELFSNVAYCFLDFDTVIKLNITKNDGKTIEGTFSGKIKTNNCNGGPLMNVENGKFKGIIK
jgi:hypothetical protein